jgi:hypothetical protein
MPAKTIVANWRIDVPRQAVDASLQPSGVYLIHGIV